MKKHKKIILILLIIIISASLFFFLKKKEIGVEVLNSETKKEVIVYGLGTIEAKITSLIGFEVSGALKEINVDHGDFVKKGDILAKLDMSEQESKVEKAATIVMAAKAKLEKALSAIPKMEAILYKKEKENTRSKKLLPKKAISKEKADETNMQEQIAKTDLEIAKKEVILSKAELQNAIASYRYEKEILNQHVLRAPYDGLIIKRHKELGSVLAKGETVFTLIDPKTIWALGYVDEARAGYVKKDQKAQIKLRSMPSKLFNGKVKRIDIESDRVNEERRIYISCKDCAKNLHLGEQAEIFIKTENAKNKIFIPQKIVKKYNETNGEIWILKNNKIYPQLVSLGQKTIDGKIEIVGGLEKDMQIIISPLHNVKAGEKAHIIRK